MRQGVPWTKAFVDRAMRTSFSRCDGTARVASPDWNGDANVFGSSELVEFSFVSRVPPGLGTSGLLRLARQSWSFNIRRGLTGTLRLTDRRFAVVIEGPCEVVQPLAARILRDDRHGSIRILAFHRIAGRRHAHWSTEGFPFVDDLPSLGGSGPRPFGAVPTLAGSASRNETLELPVDASRLA